VRRPFPIHEPPTRAYRRTVLFAVELLDAVTLERVSRGIDVVAEGLRGKPTVNNGGVFVWLTEDAPLRRLTVDPRELPYMPVERAPEELKRPLATIELAPRVAYPFPAGVTGLRGVLVEKRVTPATPVKDGAVRLQWLDEDGSTWRDAPASRTDDRGEFAAIVRLAPSDAPQVTDGALAVRLRARRGSSPERRSAAIALPRGRVADPSTFPSSLIFAWDELQP
jgi:hypothetical protein